MNEILPAVIVCDPGHSQLFYVQLDKQLLAASNLLGRVFSFVDQDHSHSGFGK